MLALTSPKEGIESIGTEKPSVAENGGKPKRGN